MNQLPTKHQSGPLGLVLRGAALLLRGVLIVVLACVLAVAQLRRQVVMFAD